MRKDLRGGKVLLDWSQNHPAKTTITPYSLRGRERPTVAAPRTWDELEDPDLRHLGPDEVVERLATIGDPLGSPRRRRRRRAHRRIAGAREIARWTVRSG